MTGTALKSRSSPADDVRLIGGNVNGRYTISGRAGIKCFACRAQSISARTMALAAPVSGEVGDAVALHFDDFGFLRGRITRLLDFGFTIELAGDDEDRARIAAKIRWLKKHVLQSAPDQRQFKRSFPRTPRSSLLLADGSRLDCFIIDMSPAGVAVSADFTPRIGQVLAVGRAVGRVIRHLEVGFAVKFAKTLDAERLEKLLEPVGGDAAPTAVKTPETNLSAASGATSSSTVAAP